MLIDKASFKNSRISPRKATTKANTVTITVSNTANTQLVPQNMNRTYLTLRSEATSSGQDIRYDYFNNPNILTEGFILKAGEAVDLESPTEVWARAVTSPVVVSVDEGEG